MVGPGNTAIPNDEVQVQMQEQYQQAGIELLVTEEHDDEPFDVVRANSSLDEGYISSSSKHSRSKLRTTTSGTNAVVVKDELKRDYSKSNKQKYKFGNYSNNGTSIEIDNEAAAAADGELPALSSFVSVSRSRSMASQNSNNGNSNTITNTNSNSSHSSTVDVRASKDGERIGNNNNIPAITSYFGPHLYSDETAITRNVTGGQSAHTRPMSPPSRAGLDDPIDSFENNIDDRRNSGSGSVGSSGSRRRKRNDSNGSGNNRYAYTDRQDDDEDENQRMRRNMQRNMETEMPMDERREYEDEMKALALCDDFEGSQGMPEFCDSALRAMNEMCAGGSGVGEGVGAVVGAADTATGGATADDQQRASSESSSKLKLGEKHSVHNGASGVEEQTAIEVEYVEPRYRGRRGRQEANANNGDSDVNDDDYRSPKRKNVLLKAMSRKAKDDFKNKTKRRGSGDNNSTNNSNNTNNDEIAQLDQLQSQQTAALEAANRDNVYATLSGAEKRKFLKLINGGVSPLDATGKILRERNQEDSNVNYSVNSSVPENASLQSSNSENFDDYDHDQRDDQRSYSTHNTNANSSNTSKKRGINKLAFWKRKNKGSSVASASVASASTSAAASTVAASTSNVAVVSPTPSPVKNPAARDQDNTANDNGNQDDDNSSSSSSSCEHVGDEIKNFLKEDREESKKVRKAKTTTTPKQRQQQPRPQPQPTMESAEDTSVRGASEIIGDLHRSSQKQNQSYHSDDDNNDNHVNNGNNKDDNDGDYNQFEKSGINYYDAVRKDRSTDYEYENDYHYNEEEVVAARSSGSSSRRHLHRKLKIPKSIKGGFSKLKHRNRATPVPEEVDDNESGDEYTGDRRYDDDMQNEEEAEMEHITSQDEMDPPGKQMIESHLSIPSPTKETLRIVGEVDDGNDGDGDETDYNENDEHENGETDQHSLPIEQTMSQESLLDETVVDTEQEVNDDQDDNDRHRHQHQQQQQHQGQVGGEEKVQGDTGAIARVMAMQGSGVVASEDDNATRAKLVGLGAVGTVSAATTTMMTNHPASATTKLEPQEENYAAATAAADEQYDDSLDMDTYLSETMSQVGGAGSSSGGNNNGIGNNNHNNSRSFDGVSVVSGRSHRTTGTNYTTQSTRSRRPGQAKVRLERERDNTNTSGMAMSIGSTHTSKSHYGWQDSIEAAALKAGKVWDPVYGWRDYVDPNRIEIPTDDFFDESMALASAQQQKQEMQAQAHGKTHANTNANVMGVAAAATAGPSMAEWGGNQQQNQQHSPSRSVGKSNPRSPARSGTPGRQRRAHKVMPTSARDDKPRGWAETMKAATAKLNMEGKQWDPVTGWDGLGEDEIPGGRDTADDVDVAITADSDLQDFGTVEQLDAIANKQDKSLQFLSEDEDQPSNNNEVDGNGNANTNYGADAEEEEATVDGDQSSATKSTSKNSGRYIQIAETGSIQSHYRRTRPNQSSRRTVNVKKENLNQGEVDLFQESAERRKGNGPVDLDSLYEKEDFPTAFPQSEQQDEVISSPNANAIYQKIYESQSNESFDSATDFSWDADEAANDTIDSYGRKPAPRLKINIRDSTSVSSRPNSAKSGKALSEASFESGTSSIPKLAAPRRDTSPIRPSKTKTKTNGAPLSEMLATATTSSHSARYNDNPFKDNDLYKETLRPGDVGSDYDENENENEIININDNCTEAVTRVVQKNQPNASYDAGSNAPPNMSELHKLWEAKTTSWDKGDDRRRESGSPKNDSPTAAAAAAPTNTQNSEWKSFLQKKVQAESAAATAEAARDNDDDDERDTIFNFDGGRSEENFKKSSSGGKPQRRESKPLLGEPDDRSAFDDISEISPIRHQNDDSESDYGQNSEASTTVLQGTTFLQRLQACAAPVMKGGPNCASDGPISAHLAFLRNNPSVAGSSPDKNASAKSATASPSSINNLMNEGKVGILQVSAGICGRPDIIVEDNEDESTIDESVPSRSPMQSPPPPYMNKIKSRDSNSSNNTSRSRSNSRSRQNANKDDLSSVISDGFGQKSAYLEAIAMKAAVAGKSKKKKRRSQESEVSATTAASTSRRSSSGSIFSSSGNSNSKRSDKFQQFLDRRASKDEHLPSPSPLQPQLPPTAAADKYEVSTRAEKYASEKVNEMMDAMARRTGTDKDDPYNRAARAQEEYEKTGAFPTLPGATKSGKDTTMLAAEELAAARVEAMMQRLSVQNLEFNEVEI